MSSCAIFSRNIIYSTAVFSFEGIGLVRKLVSNVIPKFNLSCRSFQLLIQCVSRTNSLWYSLAS